MDAETSSKRGDAIQGQGRILVVDDEVPTLKMFRLFLEDYGYTVFTATEGEEGLALFARENPSIVLTDIKMPGMDGIEVLRRIKAMSPLTEVIVITGHGDIELAVEALNLDATDFINKPIQRRALEQALERAEARLQVIRSKKEEIQIRTLPQAVMIHIRGILNADSEAHLENAYQAALAEGRHQIIISFPELASVNGAGLAILAQVLLKARKEGRDIVLLVPSLNLKSLFDISGISKLAPVIEKGPESGSIPDQGGG